MRDTSFYNQESSRYSQKRYPATPSTYIQFFYLQRLNIVRTYIQECLKEKPPATLLEVGCADGVVLRALEGSFPRSFSKVVGIDIAQNMIEEAKRKNTSPHTEFYLRNQMPSGRFDLVLEIGVVNYSVFEDELSFAKGCLTNTGRFVLSVAGTDSLNNRLRGEDGFNDFRSYKIYDELIRKDFIVEEMVGCGFFVPYLWRFPFIARLIQLAVDTFANAFGLKRFFHEKIYLLRKKVLNS